jgi:hypothetical protein
VKEAGDDTRLEEQVDPPDIRRLDPPRPRPQEPQAHQPPPRQQQGCPPECVRYRDRRRLCGLKACSIGHDRNRKLMLGPPNGLTGFVPDHFGPDRHIGSGRVSGRRRIIDRATDQGPQRAVRNQPLIDRRLKGCGRTVTHDSTSSIVWQIR